MTDTTISLRIDKRLHEQMKQIEHINWSSVLRKALIEQIEQRKESNVQKAKVQKAIENIKKIRESGVFDGGKTSVEIIREWRDKRR